MPLSGEVHSFLARKLSKSPNCTETESQIEAGPRVPEVCAVCGGLHRDDAKEGMDGMEGRADSPKQRAYDNCSGV